MNIHRVWMDAAAHAESPMPGEMLRFQERDVLWWLRREEEEGAGYRPSDFWCGQSGKSVRAAFEWRQLPFWFQLAESELAGTLPGLFKKAGILEDELSPEPLEGNGIWKVEAGDKLALFCAPRPGVGAYEPLCAVYDVGGNCLLWGCDTTDDQGPGPEFGAPDETVLNSYVVKDFIRSAISLANARPPRIVAAGGWALFR